MKYLVDRAYYLVVVDYMVVVMNLVADKDFDTVVVVVDKDFDMAVAVVVVVDRDFDSLDYSFVLIVVVVVVVVRKDSDSLDYSFVLVLECKDFLVDSVVLH